MNNAYLDAIAAEGASLITHVGLVDDTNAEVGDARQPVTWAAPSNGDVQLGGDEVYTMAPGDKVRGWQGYSAATGGTAYGIIALPPVDFGTGDTLTYTLQASLTKIAHDAG